MSRTRGFAASGFFALRTPLLPAGLASGWGDPPRTAAAAEAGGDLERAIAEDRARARAALATWLDDPVVREAVFLASPDLDASVSAWREAPDGERGQRIERALARYMLRMCGRATPLSAPPCRRR